jgi:hypothetical protein
MTMHECADFIYVRRALKYPPPESHIPALTRSHHPGDWRVDEEKDRGDIDFTS